MIEAVVAESQPRDPIPFHQWLTIQISQSGKTNIEIAQSLGYPRPNVVAMLKSGGMKLPVNKVGPMARCLGIDPVFLLERVLLDTAPETWTALREVIGDRLVTGNEIALIEYIRPVLSGFDANLIAYKEFTHAIKASLEMIATREQELARATLATIQRRSEPHQGGLEPHVTADVHSLVVPFPRGKTNDELFNMVARRMGMTEFPKGSDARGVDAAVEGATNELAAETEHTTHEARTKNHGLPAGYKRSSFAVPEDVHNGLAAAVEDVGLRSVAKLLTLVVRSQEARDALKPSAAKLVASEKVNPVAEQKATKKALQEKIKTMNPEELARLLALADGTGLFSGSAAPNDQVTREHPVV